MAKPYQTGQVGHMHLAQIQFSNVGICWIGIVLDAQVCAAQKEAQCKVEGNKDVGPVYDFKSPANVHAEMRRPGLPIAVWVGKRMTMITRTKPRPPEGP